MRCRAAHPLPARFGRCELARIPMPPQNLRRMDREARQRGLAAALQIATGRGWYLTMSKSFFSRKPPANPGSHALPPDLQRFLAATPSPVAAFILGVSASYARCMRTGKRPATPSVLRRWTTHLLVTDPPIGRWAMRAVRQGRFRFGGRQHALPPSFAASGVQAVMVSATRSGALLVMPSGNCFRLPPIESTGEQT